MEAVPPAGIEITSNGAGVVSAYDYNQRLQPSNILVTAGTVDMNCSSATGKKLHLQYDFALGAANNGNVHKISNCLNGDRSQNFTYDALNRISAAWSDGTLWGNEYVIDPWGNLTNMDAMAGKTHYQNLQAAPASPQNQLNEHCHDAAGNLLRVGTCGSNDYTYDAENRLQTAAGFTYTYDGDGRRVKKTSGGSGTLYWYAPTGEVLTETNLSGGTVLWEYIYAGGRRIGRRNPANGAIHYYFSDHLGSSRMVFDAANLTTPLDDEDFYPYGGVIPGGTSTSGQNYKFTGQERDTESGLDYFGARYYGSSLGRFTTPDPIFVKLNKLADPRSLNLYTYTRNSPLRYVDPNGEDDFDCNTQGKCQRTDNRKGLRRFFHNLAVGHRYTLVADGQRYALQGPLKELPEGQTYKVVSESTTAQRMRAFVDQHSRKKGEPGASHADVQAKSGQGGEWDFKRLLRAEFGENSLYLIAGVAQTEDYVGNMTWGYIVASHGILNVVAHIGAGRQSMLDRQNMPDFKWWWCAGSMCDDPLDYRAIDNGYAWHQLWAKDNE